METTKYACAMIREHIYQHVFFEEFKQLRFSAYCEICDTSAWNIQKWKWAIEIVKT